MNEAEHRVYLDEPDDILLATTTGLERLVDEGLDRYGLTLTHRDDGPLTVRGYHEPILHNSEDETRRGDGGNTYYHFRASGDNDEMTPWGATTCYTEVKRAPLSDARDDFIDTLLDGIERKSQHSRDDLAFLDGDIYHRETNQQLVSCSWRYLSNKNITLQRACWQNQRFNDAFDESSYLVSRDGVDPTQFNEHIGIINSRLLGALRTGRSTDIQLSRDYEAIDTEGKQLSQRIRDSTTRRSQTNTYAKEPRTCIGDYAISPALMYDGAGQNETPQSAPRTDPLGRDPSVSL